MFEAVKNTHSSCFIKVKNSSAVRILGIDPKSSSPLSLTIRDMKGCTDILYETPLEQDACAGYDKKDTPLFPKGAPVGYFSKRKQ